MIISVDVPEPKFAHGQVIEVKGEELPYHLYVHIIRVESHGQWSFRNGAASLVVEGITYTYVYQEGSRDGRGGLIRPGTIGIRDHLLEHEGTVVSWTKTIVSQDTLTNLTKRKQEWAEING
jgi:hypothetical protein